MDIHKKIASISIVNSITNVLQAISYIVIAIVLKDVADDVGDLFLYGAEYLVKSALIVGMFLTIFWFFICAIIALIFQFGIAIVIVFLTVHLMHAKYEITICVLSKNWKMRDMDLYYKNFRIDNVLKICLNVVHLICVLLVLIYFSIEHIPVLIFATVVVVFVLIALIVLNGYALNILDKR